MTARLLFGRGYGSDERPPYPLLLPQSRLAENAAPSARIRNLMWMEEGTMLQPLWNSSRPAGEHLCLKSSILLRDDQLSALTVKTRPLHYLVIVVVSTVVGASALVSIAMIRAIIFIGVIPVIIMPAMVIFMTLVVIMAVII